MWRNLTKKLELLAMRSKFIKPKKIAITGGFLAYGLGIGMWIYYHPEDLQSNITLTVNSLSRVQIPKLARTMVYTAYSKYYGVNLEEVEKPLAEYESLN